MTARKSDEIKKLSGTFRAQRALPPDFAELLAELPDPPKTLSPGAREQWRILGPSVVALGISSADIVAFALLAETLHTAESAKRDVERDGFMIAAGKSGHRTHPAVPIMEHARSQAQALLQQFRLTPKSRIGIAEPTPRSVFGKNGSATTRRGADHTEEEAQEFWSRFDLPADPP